MTVFFKNPHIIFHVTPSRGSRIVPSGWTCVSWCVVKAGGFGGWTSLSSSVLCPGLSPDHVERIQQLDSWQTDRLFLVAYRPNAWGCGVLSIGGVWGIGFFVTSYGSPD